MTPALVVFHGRGAGWLSRLLHPGFRHCFVVVDDGRYRIAIDGRAGVPDVRVVAGSGDDLARFYRRQGFTVVETGVAALPPRQPVMLGTCVGAVKRILGLRAPFVLTPYGLWRRLGRMAASASGFRLTAGQKIG